jgi:hypothetical protein
MGDFYRGMIAWLFGDVQFLPQVEREKGNAIMFPDIDYQKSVDFWIRESQSREGITVVDLKGAQV